VSGLPTSRFSDLKSGLREGHDASWRQAYLGLLLGEDLKPAREPLPEAWAATALAPAGPVV